MSWKGKGALASGQISDPAGPGNEIGMAGYVWSPKAEIYCVRYRYYDPLLGRWLQRDPPGYVDGLNVYTYGMGNPWAYSDPYGLSVAEDVEEYIGLAVDGLKELWDVGTGKAAREDAEHNQLVQEMEQNQKDKICENYQNGNVSADDAAAMYDKVDGMANELANSLAELREEEWDRIVDTGKQIAYTVVGAGVLSYGSRGVTAIVHGTRYGAHLAGPLASNIANTFRGGSYTSRVLLRLTTMYRVHGGTSRQVGSFLTRTRPQGPVQARMDMALNPTWGNNASQVTRFRVPAGTRVFEGAAGPQGGGLLGGGNQVFIPSVSPRWIIP